MDPEAFLDLANQVAKLKMYPYFDIAHAIVCCLIIKDDMGPGKTHDFIDEIFNDIELHRCHTIFEEASFEPLVFFYDVNICG